MDVLHLQVYPLEDGVTHSILQIENAKGMANSLKLSVLKGGAFRDTIYCSYFNC